MMRRKVESESVGWFEMETLYYLHAKDVKLRPNY
jgi:hypothetical protein